MSRTHKLNVGKILDIAKALILQTEDFGTYDVFTLTFINYENFTPVDLLKFIERRFRKMVKEKEKDPTRAQTVAENIVRLLISWTNTSFGRDFVIKKKVLVQPTPIPLSSSVEALSMLLAEASSPSNNKRDKKLRKKRRGDQTGSSSSECDLQIKIKPLEPPLTTSADEEQEDPSEDLSGHEDLKYTSVVTVDMYNSLLAFLDTMSEFGFTVEANRVKLAVIRARPRSLLISVRENRKSRTYSTKKNIKIQDLQIHDIAEQLTAFESRMYCSIKLSEFLGMSWQKDGKMTKAPHIVKMYGRFNQVSYWIASQICNCEDFKERTTVVSSFISLAVELKELKNFNALMEILGGLNNVAVQRMKRTWAVINEKFGQTWEELNSLMDSANNYKNYREALSQATLPCVPFLGVYLRDLTFIEENPEIIKKKINFERMRMIGSVLTEVKRFQAERFIESQKSAESHSFIRQVREVPLDGDDILYEASLKVEPKDEVV